MTDKVTLIVNISQLNKTPPRAKVWISFVFLGMVQDRWLVGICCIRHVFRQRHSCFFIVNDSMQRLTNVSRYVSATQNLNQPIVYHRHCWKGFTRVREVKETSLCRTCREMLCKPDVYQSVWSIGAVSKVSRYFFSTDSNFEMEKLNLKSLRI